METTAYRPSVESMALDSDRPASHHTTASYIRARAPAHRLDEAMPLFLSDPLGEPDPREYTPRALRPRTKTRIVSQLFATGVAACGAAIIVTSFQADLRDLVAGLLPRAAMALNSAPALRQVLLKDPARVSNIPASLASQEPVPPAPNREAISSAYLVALQARSQAQLSAAIQAPAAAQPSPAEPVRTLDAETLEGLMARARSLLNVGDLTAARLLLERAANANDATAAFLLAQTHDPAVLGASDARSVVADEAAARGWYQRAASLGSTEARRRLAQLSN